MVYEYRIYVDKGCPAVGVYAERAVEHLRTYSNKLDGGFLIDLVLFINKTEVCARFKDISGWYIKGSYKNGLKNVANEINYQENVVEDKVYDGGEKEWVKEGDHGSYL